MTPQWSKSPTSTTTPPTSSQKAPPSLKPNPIWLRRPSTPPRSASCYASPVEQYRQPNTPAQLAQSVARSVTRRADLAFLSETAPTAPAVAPTAGLLNTTGIVDSGAVSASLDALVDLVATLQVNLATPSHIVVGPLGWAELRKLKQSATANNVSLLGAGNL